MQKLMTVFIMLYLLSASLVTHAGPMHEFEFADAKQEEIFNRLSHEIRCLVCQNQAIGESNADLAKDLREEIYGMLKKGMTEQEVIDFLVHRYGDFVLYNPPMKPMTWMLWFGPLIIFFIALFYTLRFVRSRKVSTTEQRINEGDLERLKSLQSEARQSTDSQNRD